MHTAYKCFLGMYNLISLFSRIPFAPELAQAAPCRGVPAAAAPRPMPALGARSGGSHAAAAASRAGAALPSLPMKVFHGGQGPTARCHAPSEPVAAHEPLAWRSGGAWTRFPHQGGQQCPLPATGPGPSPSAGSGQARSWGRAFHSTYLSGGTAVHQYLFQTPRKPG